MLLQTCHSMVIFVSIAMYLLSAFHAGSVSAFNKYDQLQEGPVYPDIFEESPVTPDTFQESPVAPHIFQKGPVYPDIFQKSPVAPHIFQKGPVYPDIFQKGPVYPDIFQKSPVTPHIFQKGPVYPDIFQESPVYPDIFQKSPVAPHIFQKGPVYPDIFQESPSAPDIFQESPGAPDIFGKYTISHKSPFQDMVDDYSSNSQNNQHGFKEFSKNNFVLNVNKNQVASYGKQNTMWEALRKEGEKLNGYAPFDTAYMKMKTTQRPLQQNRRPSWFRFDNHNVPTTRMPEYLNNLEEFSLDILLLNLAHKKKDAKPLQGNRKPLDSNKWLPVAPFDNFWLRFENQDPAHVKTMTPEYLKNQETNSKSRFLPFNFPYRNRIVKLPQTMNKIIANNKANAKRLREHLKFGTRKYGNFGAGLKDHLLRNERPLVQGSAYVWPKWDGAVLGKPGARKNNVYATIDSSEKERILKVLQDIYSKSIDLGELFSEVILGAPLFRYENQVVRPEVTMKDFIWPLETPKLQTPNNRNKELQNVILTILQENLNYQNGVGPDPLATSGEDIDLILLQLLQQ